MNLINHYFKRLLKNISCLYTQCLNPHYTIFINTTYLQITLHLLNIFVTNGTAETYILSNLHSCVLTGFLISHWILCKTNKHTHTVKFSVCIFYKVLKLIYTYLHFIFRNHVYKNYKLHNLKMQKLTNLSWIIIEILYMVKHMWHNFYFLYKNFSYIIA